VVIRSGVLLVGSKNSPSRYVEDAYQVDKHLGARLEFLTDADAVRKVFPEDVELGPLSDAAGYLNHDGGWANASKGIRAIATRVITLGAKIHTGKTVEALLRREDGRTVGVRCADGTEYRADVVILATGSWTASAFPELKLQDQCLATGCVCFLQSLFPGVDHAPIVKPLL
jgi:sarcosine oxidase/L-pipecolate oxidase